MHEMTKTQFVSLPEALCIVVSTLHKLRQPSHLPNIYDMLRRQYIGMSIPKKEIIHCALETLTAEGRLCKTGDTYFMASSPWSGFPPYMFPMFDPSMGNPHANMVSSMSSHMAGSIGNLMGPPPSYPNPSPYNHPWWTNSLPRSTGTNCEKTSKPELCSTECQTGASIVNGIGPYVPKDNAPVKTQATKAIGSGAKEGKAKRTFMEKIFRRRSKSKPRDGGAQTKPIAKGPVRSTSADSKLSNAVAKTETREAPTPTEVPHHTFSAQFPPPEWLYRPVVGKSNSRNRLSLAPKDLMPSEEDDVFAPGTWIDAIPRNPAEIKFRRRTGDLRFASQRAPMTIFEENDSVASKESTKRTKHRQRLSKYLSSSSECLKSIDFHDDSMSSPKKRSHTRKHNDHRHMNTNHVYRLDSHNTQSPVKYPGEPVPKSFEASPPRLMTSTPTPPELLTHVPQTHDPNTTQKSDNSQNDSALSSASPVDSGPLEQRRKYSSWSSVEDHAPLPYPSPNTSDPMGGEAPADPTNHTYENLPKPPSTFDHTYENMGRTLDATKYEDITNYAPLEDRNDKKMSDIAPRISRTCVSSF